ncbi:MAG: bifunctional hydroxymethylpyrimidine kinase/phosphomethylpyrimidine kinase [Pseudomonadota bacterium]
MARVIAFSSQVAWGHIGNSAGVFALQRLGHDVCALPTILLSNRPGLPHVAGAPVPADTLASMIDALDNNGWLGGVDLVMTGYLPTPEHVDVAGRLIDAVRSAQAGEKAGTHKARILCDPVMGDDPKGLYIDPDAAARIRDGLIGRADVITPNRFELSWLSGCDVTGPTSALSAAGALSCPAVVATSVPDADDFIAPRLLNLLLTPSDRGADAARSTRFPVPHRGKVPNGTGDFLAGLIAAVWLRGLTLPAAIATSVACVDTAILATQSATGTIGDDHGPPSGRDGLDLIGSQTEWADLAEEKIAALQCRDGLRDEAQLSGRMVVPRGPRP